MTMTTATNWINSILEIQGIDKAIDWSSNDSNSIDLNSLCLQLNSSNSLPQSLTFITDILSFNQNQENTYTKAFEDENRAVTSAA